MQNTIKLPTNRFSAWFIHMGTNIQRYINAECAVKYLQKKFTFVCVNMHNLLASSVPVRLRLRLEKLIQCSCMIERHTHSLLPLVSASCRSGECCVDTIPRADRANVRKASFSRNVKCQYPLRSGISLTHRNFHVTYSNIDQMAFCW